MEGTSEKVKVEFAYLPVINFAMQQNRVSAIRQLSIENLTKDALKDLKITLSSQPRFADAIPISIEARPAG